MPMSERTARAARRTLAAGVGLGACDHPAAHGDAALGGLLEQGQAPEQGGLAGTARSNDTDHVALGNRQRHARQHLMAAKALADACRSDDRRTRHGPTRYNGGAQSPAGTCPISLLYA